MQLMSFHPVSVTDSKLVLRFNKIVLKVLKIVTMLLYERRGMCDHFYP